jgi:NAD(P)-dependent dehydrogenase (short-subunit alcohol dehydrogenase family)
MTSTIIVTGASSGFGAMTVRALADAGHDVHAGMRDIDGHNAGAAEDARAYARDHSVRLLGFLPEPDVRRTLGQTRAVSASGPAGSEIAVDTWGTWMRDHQDDHDALNVVNARLEWFCDTPAAIEALAPGLRGAESITLADAPDELLGQLSADERAMVEAAHGQPQLTNYKLNRFTVEPGT